MMIIVKEVGTNETFRFHFSFLFDCFSVLPALLPGKKKQNNHNHKRLSLSFLSQVVLSGAWPTFPEHEIEEKLVEVAPPVGFCEKKQRKRKNEIKFNQIK